MSDVQQQCEQQPEGCWAERAAAKGRQVDGQGHIGYGVPPRLPGVVQQRCVQQVMAQEWACQRVEGRFGWSALHSQLSYISMY